MLLSALDIEQLRRQHYNARVLKVIRLADELFILRVRPDAGLPRFVAGQYTTLGLGTWEPRVDGLPDELTRASEGPRVIKRAYSVSCPLECSQGRLLLQQDYDYLEFYIALVRPSQASAPSLTPRLFCLQEGDRLQCGTHFHGHYTIGPVLPDRHVLFVATGTGEAPHNAMLAELLARGHRGNIVSTICVRHRRDLAYLEAHRRLEHEFANYRYLPITTREPENLDSTHPGYIGKRYVQSYLESGQLEQESGVQFQPANSHVFLCGNPQMIGVPHHTHDPVKRYPVPRGMVEVLEQRGFAVDQPHEPGNIHFEKYW
jgi:ferredoxin--NADP+ reductase